MTSFLFESVTISLVSVKNVLETYFYMTKKFKNVYDFDVLIPGSVKIFS